MDLYVPGRGELLSAPDDWPERLHPGSLNVGIDTYPDDLARRGLPNRTEALDSGLFLPTFEIAREQFRNNLLVPRPDVPRGGDAQVWRAKLIVADTGTSISCWALRRFGSRVREQLEFVAERRLRDEGLVDRLRVHAVLLGRWRDESAIID